MDVLGRSYSQIQSAPNSNRKFSLRVFNNSTAGVPLNSKSEIFSLAPDPYPAQPYHSRSSLTGFPPPGFSGAPVSPMHFVRPPPDAFGFSSKSPETRPRQRSRSTDDIFFDPETHTRRRSSSFSEPFSNTRCMLN